MQFDVTPDRAGNVLCEDTQTVRPYRCDFLSTPKKLFFLFRQGYFEISAPLYVTLLRLVVSYRRFGTTSRFHLQGCVYRLNPIFLQMERKGCSETS
jgi:hypothetical protein